MFIYTALGDSITFGELASSPSQAYPSLVDQIFRKTTSKPIVVNVLAEPGWTSKSLLNAVLQTPAYVLKESSAISIWVGGDDLANAGMALLQGAPRSTIEASLKQYERDILRLIAAIRNISNAHIILCTQYNPFPASPIAAEAIAALNQMTEIAANRMKTSLVPIHSRFAGKQPQLIAGYRNGKLEDILTSPILPIHPNNLGHRVIADALTPFIIC